MLACKMRKRAVSRPRPKRKPSVGVERSRGVSQKGPGKPQRKRWRKKSPLLVSAGIITSRLMDTAGGATREEQGKKKKRVKAEGMGWDDGGFEGRGRKQYVPGRSRFRVQLQKGMALSPLCWGGQAFCHLLLAPLKMGKRIFFPSLSLRARRSEPAVPGGSAGFAFSRGAERAGWCPFGGSWRGRRGGIWS